MSIPAEPFGFFLLAALAGTAFSVTVLAGLFAWGWVKSGESE